MIAYAPASVAMSVMLLPSTLTEIPAENAMVTLSNPVSVFVCSLPVNTVSPSASTGAVSTAFPIVKETAADSAAA